LLVCACKICIVASHRARQLEAALADREATLKEQSAVLQSAFVTIVSNRRLLLQLQQVMMLVTALRGSSEAL
jgi:hypothetical protein